MHRSLVISAYFIKKGIACSSPISPMKLQKLLYFSHGWHLGTFKEPLLIEEFEAWKFGPVLPNVYYHFKKYGPFPIKEIPMGVDFSEVYGNSLNHFLDVIWNVYSPLTAEHLSALTHLKDSPWDKVYRPYVNNIPIPNEEIENYFVNLKSSQDASASTS
jgi:uncharacterized phage-associated protein